MRTAIFIAGMLIANAITSGDIEGHLHMPTALVIFWFVFIFADAVDFVRSLFKGGQ